MNVVIGCAALGGCTVLMLPPAPATFLGGDPPLPHRDEGSVRLPATAATTAYAAVLTEAVPRLVGVLEPVPEVCSYTATILAVGAAALCVVHERAATTPHCS
ncbi:hypothetical protein [Streptomyces sp. NPDC101234]|uniref:hypothetical protein n=1 Tax=Streptomyces sp. NPDC101234 TaxID=3366138 RepID=UPI003810AD1E